MLIWLDMWQRQRINLIMKIKFKKHISLLSLFICLLSYLFIGSFRQLARAQSFDIGLYPPVIQIKAIAPISLKTSFQIQNYSDQTINLNIAIHPFRSSANNNGAVNILWHQSLSGADNGISHKIQIFDEGGNLVTQISLAPKQSKKMFLHLGLPKDEPPGDYYFSLIFLSNTDQTNQNTSSFLQAGVAMNILLSIGPYKSPLGFLEKFATPFLVGNGPINIKILVANPNTYFINPKGNLVIYNLFNQIVGKVNLLPVNILAKSQRYLPDDKSGSLTNAVWNEKALLGIYRIKLSLLLTPSGPLFKQNIYFLALPYQAVLAIIIFCFLLTITILSIKERLKN